MSFMNCPRCGLCVRLRASYLTLERCPRCLAKRGISVTMYVSDDPHRATLSVRPTRPDASRRVGALGSIVVAHSRRVDVALIPGALVVASDRHEETHLVAPAGELDLATADALERELLLAEKTDARVIEVDLAGLTFIDSAGVHMLTRAADRVGPRLRLLPGPPVVQRVFALAGVDGALPFVRPGGSLGGSPTAVPRNDFYVDWSL